MKLSARIAHVRDHLTWYVAAVIGLFGWWATSWTVEAKAAVGFAGSTLGSLAVDLLPIAWRRLAATVGFVASWVAIVALTSDTRFVFPAVLSLAVACGAIGWGQLCDRSTRLAQWRDGILAGRALHVIRYHVHEFIAAARLPDNTKVEGIERGVDDSANIVLRVPGDSDTLDKSAGTVASVLHLPRKAVSYIADPGNHSIARLRIESSDPFRHKKPWPLPASLDELPQRVSIRTGWSPGYGRAGNPLVRLALLARHWLVSGITRSGKTHVLQQVCAFVAICDDARLWVIDTAKRGADFARWRPHADEFVTTPEEAAEALDRLIGIMEARYTLRASEGRTGEWDPRREGPQIVVVVDEAASAFRVKGVDALVLKLAAEAAGAGITLVLGTQKPEGRIFDTNIRHNLGTRICLNVETAQISDMCLRPGAAREGMDASTLPLHGHFYVYTPGYTNPHRGRAWWVEDHVLDAWAAAIPPRGGVEGGREGTGTANPLAIGRTGSAPSPSPFPAPSGPRRLPPVAHLGRYAVPVLEALPARHTDLVRSVGADAKTVRSTLRKLAAAGAAVQRTDGTWDRACSA